MAKREAQLGDRVRDMVTGYTGIVVAKHYYLNGCCQCSIQSKARNNGLPVKWESSDIGQLVVTKANVVSVADKKKKDPGGPQPTVKPMFADK